MTLFLLVFLSSLTALCQCLDITGWIQTNNYLPSPSVLPASTLFILAAPGLEYTTHPTSTGKFIFRNVTAGPSYLLRVECITHTFPPLRVDTEEDAVEIYQTFQGNEWDHRGAKLTYPISIAPTSKPEYYMQRTGFKLELLWKNPMILLALLSLGMVILIPKLTASLDPETLAEYRAQQAQTAANAPQLPSFDFASFMAGSSKTSTDKTRKSE